MRYFNLENHLTTIAYKNNIIAYDSRLTRGDLILSDNHDKMIVRGNIHFWGTGNTTDIDKLIDAYFSPGNIQPPVEANVLVLDNGELYQLGFDPDSNPPEFWKSKLDMNNCDAFGTGQLYAFTAMDMGASAKEAVEMAAKRDIFTGGEVRTFWIPGNHVQAA